MTPPVTYREITYAELAPILRERFGSKPVAKNMRNDPPRLWVGAFVGDEIVSCASVSRLAHPSIGLMQGSYTLKAWRRRGIYRGLAIFRMRCARAHGVRVLVGRMTDMSRDFHASLGMVAPHGLNAETVMIGDLDHLLRADDAGGDA